MSTKTHQIYINKASLIEASQRERFHEIILKYDDKNLKMNTICKPFDHKIEKLK